MVHMPVDDLLDEMADGGALADGVGTMMDRTASVLRVFKEHNSVDAGAIVVARRPALVEKIQIRFKSI
jgi:hypothetical protein